MAAPAGGDGFDVIVDPKNPDRMVGEYTDGTMYSSTNGGRSFFEPVSPGCVAQATVGLTPRDTCDPSMRFVDPARPGPAGARRLGHRRPIRVGQQGRLGHELHHHRLLLAEGVRHRGEQCGHGALLANHGRVIYAAWVAAAVIPVRRLPAA